MFNTLEYWNQNIPMAYIEEGYDYEYARRERYRIIYYLKDIVNFESYRGKNVLEIGCGSGIDSAEFARNGASVTSVDFSDKATYLTQKLFDNQKFLADIRKADITNLPFLNETFDLVYSFGVLHHIPEVAKSIYEIYRTLIYGGEFIGMLYNKNSLLYAYSIIYLHGIKEGLLEDFSEQEILSRFSEKTENCPYTKAYTKQEAYDLFSKHFRKVNITAHYGVIDTPQMRKRLISDSEDLGWHLIIKCKK